MKRKGKQLDVLALAVADVHLSQDPPVARSAEPDWIAAQRRVLEQVADLRHELGMPPLFIAGDTFHRWDASNEVVNMVLGIDFDAYTVPGQHEMPMHRLDDLRKSAYSTMTLASKFFDISAYRGRDIARMNVWGVAFGEQVETPSDCYADGFKLLVHHGYIWMKDTGYGASPAEAHASKWFDRLRGYTSAVFGDNHIPFNCQTGGCNLFNCGCLIPRRSNERGTKPSVGMLMSDGTWQRHYLDTSADRWLDAPQEQIERAENRELGKFVKQLEELSLDALDFGKAVRDYIRDHELRAEVARELLQSIQGKREQ